MTDNFELLKYQLTFNSENDLYFVEILKRKKEHPDISKSVKKVDEFFFTQEKNFDHYKNKIIEICDLNNARAYIRVNKRNKQKLALRTLQWVANYIANDQFDPHLVRKAYSVVAGKYHSEDSKKWIVDIDGSDLINQVDIIDCIAELEPNQDTNKVLFEIPTKNGLHLITSPFRLDHFKNRFPGIDVHKDNPTILYCP